MFLSTSIDIILQIASSLQPHISSNTSHFLQTRYPRSLTSNQLEVHLCAIMDSSDLDNQEAELLLQRLARIRAQRLAPCCPALPPLLSTQDILRNILDDASYPSPPPMTQESESSESESGTPAPPKSCMSSSVSPARDQLEQLSQPSALSESIPSCISCGATIQEVLGPRNL